MWNKPDEPYQELPPLPPAREVETATVLKSVIDASRRLAELKAACTRLPDPTMLINTVPLLEAQASSEIENIVTTQDEVFRAAGGALPSRPTPALKEALRYRSALNRGVQALEMRPLGINTATSICSVLMGHEAPIRSTAGTYIGNPTTQERIYTPPQGRDLILRHLSSWETFLHANHNIDPLVAMALQHYQFEAIHPFTDGNGRTGRILNLLYLIHADILQLPVLYLSGYIVRHKGEYYERLRAVTRHDDWESWILYILSAVAEMSTWTLNLIDTITRLQHDAESIVRQTIPRAPAAELTRLLFTQPYIRIDNVVDAGLAQRQAASRWLVDLAQAGLIHAEHVGRSKIYVNDALLHALFSAPLSH